MIRLIWRIALVLLLAVATAYIAGLEGHVRIATGGYVLELSAALLVAGALSIFAVGAFGVWFILWLRREMPFVGSGRALARQQRGLKLLNRGLVALASGDAKSARRLAAQAGTLVPNQPLVHMLAAEAAVKAGDDAGAIDEFKALEASEDARFIGLRGQVLSARRRGQSGDALKLARKAYSEVPKSPWVMRTLFALEADAGHWAEAEALLKQLERQKFVSAVEAKKHRGALLYCQGNEKALAADTEALALYKQALANRPDFAPAIGAAARLEHKANKKRAAETRLKKAWGGAPHPALLRAWESLDTSATRADKLARAKQLVAAQPDHMLSHQTIAAAAIDAGALEEANAAVAALQDFPTTRRSAKLALDLARLQGSALEPHEEALAAATEGAAWQCDTCANREDLWTPLCERCGEFDSLSWKEEVVHRAVAGTKSQAPLMLLSDGESSIPQALPGSK